MAKGLNIALRPIKHRPFVLKAVFWRSKHLSDGLTYQLSLSCRLPPLSGKDRALSNSSINCQTLRKRPS